MLRSHSLLALPAVAALFAAAPTARADVEVGQPAPAFALPAQDGKIHRLSEYRGTWVVLAYYPNDFTGGWTSEFDALRRAWSRSQARNSVAVRGGRGTRGSAL